MVVFVFELLCVIGGKVDTVRRKVCLFLCLNLCAFVFCVIGGKVDTERRK